MEGLVIYEFVHMTAKSKQAIETFVILHSWFYRTLFCSISTRLLLCLHGSILKCFFCPLHYPLLWTLLAKMPNPNFQWQFSAVSNYLFYQLAAFKILSSSFFPDLLVISSQNLTHSAHALITYVLLYRCFNGFQIYPPRFTFQYAWFYF